jgi:hypothetical protein
MSCKKYGIGDLVKILQGEWVGTVGIVTKPMDGQNTGHVLVYKDGSIFGMDASVVDLEVADESSEGFAQLGYHLIKLGSHVIEQKLLTYRT